MSKNNLKILDCTLRDGGYINNWEFGEKNISKILALLSQSGIDIIECGFLKKNIKYNPDFTLFDSVNTLQNLLSEQEVNSKYTVMVNYGAFDIDYYPKNIVDIEIRIAFKPHELNAVSIYAKQLIDKGYKISLNPMHASIYTVRKMLNLISITNELLPECLTIVDTMGTMTVDDTIDIFEWLDSKLNMKVALGFHSHNNLNLSLDNTRTILDLNLDRDIIIDSSIAGIGRGAGLLKTEIIAECLNNYYNKNYDINKLSQISDKYIKSIGKEWGYSYPYYLSAKHKCHPNYAKYIIENTNFTNEDINKIFSLIPEKNRIIFNYEIIESLIKNLTK